MKLTDLVDNPSISTDDLLYVVDFSGVTPTSYRMSVGNLINFFLDRANTFTESPQTIICGSSSTVGLIVRAVSGQTEDLQEWKDNNGLTRISVSPRDVGTDTDPMCISYKPGIHEYLIGTDDTSGAFRFVKTDDTDKYVAILPEGAIHLGGDGSKIILGVTDIISSDAGGTSTIRIGCRSTDFSDIVGGETQFWTNTGQTLPVWGVMAPGGGSYLVKMAAGGWFEAPSTSTIGLIIRAVSSQTSNLQEWQNSSGGTLSAVKADGSIQPASMADGSATNNSIYYSTTQNKLCYKDSGGVVNQLY
jgi:hypothetical protein